MHSATWFDRRDQVPELLLSGSFHDVDLVDIDLVDIDGIVMTIVFHSQPAALTNDQLKV